MDEPQEAHSAPNVLSTEALPSILGRRVISAPSCERPLKLKRWQTLVVDDEGRAPVGICHFPALMLGATGVVFGDIGTSPLYTLNGVFVDALHTGHPMPQDITETFSMIFWLLTWVVAVKYIGFMMRVSHHGEGGTFALMHRVVSPGVRDHAPLGARTQAAVAFMAILGCSFIAGDGCITPVISVLGALEGIPLGIGSTGHAVVAAAILVLIFLMQRRGSHWIGLVAGPVTVCWFLTIAALGVYNLAQHPQAARQVLGGFNPAAIYNFWVRGNYRGVQAWRSLAGVVLSVTGAEALYADMGHFGAGPISAAWFGLVYPCLVLQYMGQAAALCARPEGVASPFYHAVPASLKWPMVVLATMAAIIASQALISGLFSILTQAHALKFLPRILVLHTNPSEPGQVYIPEVNWALCIVCLAVCFAFKTSSRLAGAYGIAVTSTFLLTTLLFWLVLRRVWRWRMLPALLLIVPMLTVDLLLWSANLLKIVDSGWVPLAISVVVCLLMHTYSWGRKLEESIMTKEGAIEAEQMRTTGGAVESLATISTVPALHALLRSACLVRTDRAAVFLTPYEWRVPRTIGTLATRLGCLPQTIVLLSVHFKGVPFVAEGRRASFASLGAGVFRIVLHFGYAEPLTAQRLALQKSLADVGRKHVRRHHQLKPLLTLHSEDVLTSNECMSIDGGLPIDGTMAIEEGRSQFPHVVADGGRQYLEEEHQREQNIHGPTFVLHKLHYATRPGAGHGLWDRLRIALYSFLVLNARKSIPFFGLEGSHTMEISVVRFL